MIITNKILENHMACNEGVKFFTRNYPNGLDLDKYQIIGDYNNWVNWLYKWICNENNIFTTQEFDDNGRIVSEISNSLNYAKYKYKYDVDKKTVIEIVIITKYYIFTYDHCRNLVKRVEKNTGLITEMKCNYSDNGILISKISSNGSSETYDDMGSIIEKKFSCGTKIIRSYLYDKGNIIGIFNENGNLVSQFEYIFKNDLLMEIICNNRKICWLEEK